MSLDERRWQRAWFFLSLDRTRPYFGNLWLSLEKPDQFQESLRKVILPWLRANDYLQQSGAVHSQIINSLSQLYKPEDSSYLCYWVNYIFIHGGADRLPESIWRAISNAASPTLFGDSIPATWIFDLMYKLKVEQKKHIDIFNEFKKKINPNPDTAWDRTILKIECTETDDIDNLINLIVTYNIFLFAWEEVCSNLNYDELCQIYQMGKRVASQIGMQDLRVCFPGNWRYGSAYCQQMHSRTA